MRPQEEMCDDRRVVGRRARSLNWTLLFFYFLIVMGAMFGEMFTPFSLATFGYYYISGLKTFQYFGFALIGHPGFHDLTTCYSITG